MTLTRTHLGILRVLRECPDSTTGQLKRVTRARLGQITYYLSDLQRAGLADMHEEPQKNGTTLKRWRAR